MRTTSCGPERQEAGNYKYAKSFLALAMPVAYCMLDAAGTFADNRVLEIRPADEDSANVAYELTFLLAGVVCFVYVVLIKKDRLVPKMEAPKYTGAIFETAGQFAYIYAIADTEHLAMSAPIISSYCAASVLWSRHLPEGEALLEALRHDRLDCGRYRHHGCVRPVTKTPPVPWRRGRFRFHVAAVLLDPLVQPGHEEGQQKTADTADHRQHDLPRGHIVWWE